MPEPTSPLAPEVSPLTEADPNSLNEFISNRVAELFNTVPLKITDDDLKVMVEYYQRERARFKLESDQKEKKEPKAAKRKTPTSVADAISGLDLI